jgi:hypothetical protein
MKLIVKTPFVSYCPTHFARKLQKEFKYVVTKSADRISIGGNYNSRDLQSEIVVGFTLFHKIRSPSQTLHSRDYFVKDTHTVNEGSYRRVEARFLAFPTGSSFISTRSTLANTRPEVHLELSNSAKFAGSSVAKRD